MPKADFDQPAAHTIDLASVRETLAYIESDLSRSATFDQLASTIRAALEEIAQLEKSGTHSSLPRFAPARFLPTRSGA